MLLLLQNVLYCLLYASLIKCAVRNDGRNCLYFYPKEYIEEAQKRGIADKETVMKRSKWFMIPFCIIIFVALILIISVWNHVMDFKTAYLQACLFLVVMNWFDGIVIDRLWVEHSRIWHIDGYGRNSVCKALEDCVGKTRGGYCTVFGGCICSSRDCGITW